MRNFKGMTQEEMVDLLDKAKNTYYNTGEEILSDAEYDELERLAGLENKNYVGSDRGNYDVKHSFIMGSLGKVQVKEDKKSGEVNWDECAEKIQSVLNKADGASYYETTPKLDGASFSAEFKNRNGKAYLASVATRGNGSWGTDISHWFKPVLTTGYWNKIDEAVSALCKENSNDIFCIRGEVLVRQSAFSSKYVNNYVNPRAFTAGMLGIKYEDANEDDLLRGSDLHFVCYDYRLVSGGDYQEFSWMNPYDPSYDKIKPFLNHIGELPDMKYCLVHKFNGKFTSDDLKEIYDFYDKFRKEESEYALDGVVFKPNVSARQYNLDRPRPVDCIAMKFFPMINMTTINGYSWKVGKTGEYYPTAILEPFKMEDGKQITKASAHNYNWIVANNCGIGSKVRVSLAGDIIPFIYEVVDHIDAEGNMDMPEDSYIEEKAIGNDGKQLHLMKKFTGDEEEFNQFLNSSETLNINSIGPAAAEDLYYAMKDEFPNGLTNIIYLMTPVMCDKIIEKLGKSKSVQNYVDNLKSYASAITLYDIIRSFNFKLCGKKASEICAKIISGKQYDATSIPGEAYTWALDNNSRQSYLVKDAMNLLNVEIEDTEDEDTSDKTPIIMTGSPDDCTRYATKSAWLQAHPQYVETTSWKECKILFTNDIESTTGKMKKAKSLGIEIRQYDDNGVKEAFDFNKIPGALF